MSNPISLPVLHGRPFGGSMHDRFVFPIVTIAQ